MRRFINKILTVSVRRPKNIVYLFYLGVPKKYWFYRDASKIKYPLERGPQNTMVLFKGHPKYNGFSKELPKYRGFAREHQNVKAIVKCP